MSGMSQKDFERLCKSIDNTISKVANLVGNGLSEAGNSLNDALNKAYENQGTNEKIPTIHDIAQRVKETTKNEVSKFRTPAQALVTNQYQQYQMVQRSRFRSVSGTSVAGILLAAFGGVLTFSCGIGLVSTLSMGFGAFDPYLATQIPAGVLIASDASLAVLTGLSAWGLGAGIGKLRLASQVRAFQRVFGNREVCSFKELASALQTSEKKVITAAKKMLKKGYLPQGHIDDAETCLMVTNEAYQYYLSAIATQKKRELEQKAQNRAKALGKEDEIIITDEVQAFIANGQSYQSQLRDLDIAIDDELISSQIQKIDNTVDRILNRVSERPSCIDGLGRLMDYFLPVTIKLLSAYDELENESIQGENIKNSRLEIEETLGNLVLAYEKLLDSTYQDLSMDVSADISVLNAVLAQEGLTESPFDMNTKQDNANDELS